MSDKFSTTLDKLMQFRTYSEAENAIKETLGSIPLKRTTQSLLQTAYSIGEKQGDLKRQFLGDFVRETHEEHEKKVSETDDNTSHSSTTTGSLPKQGEEHNAPEAPSEQPDKKDQMGVAVNETYPGMQPPGMPPQGMQQMSGQCPPPQGQGMPPQMTPQQMTQYTIQETLKIITPQIDAIKEAITGMDKKIQESVRIQPDSLDIKGGQGNAVRETTGSLETTQRMGKSQRLQQKHREITRLNNHLYQGGSIGHQ